MAVAAHVSALNKNIFVIEKEETFGQGASSRNSEVIHVGIYYPSDSIKAKTCVEGNRLLYALCESQHIPFKRLGKLIVATCAEEEQQLERLLKQGRENGVEGLELIDKTKVGELEPNVQAACALFSPASGIIDSHALMSFLSTQAKDNGAGIVYQSKVEGIEKKAHTYEITTRTSNDETFIFESDVVINAAGLYSDSIARMVGMDTSALHYTLSFCKGQYFRLSPEKSTMIERLIYPVPEQTDGGLGIHLTPDMCGQVRLGPDAVYMKQRTEDYTVDANKQKYFFDSVRVFAPFIKNKDDFSPDTAGIRAKLQSEGQGFRDFVIQEESDNGFPGFVNCIGIESPGLTAALSIARYVENLLPIRKN